MENKNLYSKFESLPAEAQKQVLVFIDFLGKRYASRSKKSRSRKPITNKKFVGLWKNREDLKDSSSWIKKVRKKEWKEIG